MNASTLTGQLQAPKESGKQSRHLGKSQFFLQTTVPELKQIVSIKKITDLIMDISFIKPSREARGPEGPERWER